MRTKTATWYETKVKYDRMMDNGLLKTATEMYVVEALSFTEAEALITESMSAFVSGEFKITNIAEASYKELFFSSEPADDHWYKAKLQFITIDEETEKEKRQNVHYLIQAHTLPQAVEYINEVMSKTMIDYVVASIAETSIMDVYEHKLSIKGKASDD